MATTPEACVSYELNIQMCPCGSESCDNRGICCECVRSHYESESLSACMRGTKRDPDTMSLNERANKVCDLNYARNLDFCICTAEPCDNKGVCCNCVRNHFKVTGDDRTACMRAMA